MALEQDNDQEQVVEKTTTAETVVESSKKGKSKQKKSSPNYSQGFKKAKVIVVTSGKGGVGKTTSSAAISSGLAIKGFKTVVIDFDVGLRNLDLIMGCERRVVYDFVNVIKKEATLNQALIKDKNNANLFVLPASQTRDKDALTKEGVYNVLKELDDRGFDYIICDSPAGIETGALMALYFADIAVVTTNPEVSSVRDSDRIIGILDSKSRRAEYNLDPIKPWLLLTRYSPARVENDAMLSKDDVIDLLNIELIGVIPESEDVLKASNLGKPVIYDEESNAGQAYMDTVRRILGEEVPFRFLDVEKKGWFQRLFGKK
ncbi:MAG: septum site-determining protein MinD [Succinivibrionaceae bacterium]